MKRVFALDYRSGSRLFLEMLGFSNQLKDNRLQTYIPSHFMAASKEDCPCIARDYTYDIENLADDIMSRFQYTDISFWTRLAINDSKYRQPLPELDDSWKTVMLIRDGRNQIASRIEHLESRGRVIPNFLTIASQDWKRQAQLCLQLKQRDNCKIVKFEDFVQDPINNFKEIMNFMHLTPDDSHLQSITLNDPSQSAYGSFEKLDTRWEGFSSEQMQTVTNIISPELHALGYIY